MGRYDIPACIEYVLDVTEQEKLAAYVGYSLGCTLFFIGAINKPKVNDQVDMMIGLGATSSIAHLDNFYYYLGLFVKPYHVMIVLFSFKDVRFATCFIFAELIVGQL